MRKTIYILTASFTFFLSVTVYFVFLNFTVDKTKLSVMTEKYESLPVHSLCEVTNNIEFYKEKDIRLKIYVGGKTWKYEAASLDVKCEYPRAGISFWLSDSSTAKVEKTFNEINKDDYDGLMKVVEVEAVGKIYDGKEFGRFGDYRFSFEAREIKQVSSVKEVTWEKWYDREFSLVVD